MGEGKEKGMNYNRFKLIASLVVLLGLSYIRVSADVFPSPPQDFKGISLEDTFAPPIGNGSRINTDLNTLVMSDTTSQTGAIWGKSRIDLTKGFELEGYIYLGNQEGDAADGMTFTLQNYGNNVIGESGQGLGAYGRDIGEKRYALEFDQYWNGDGYDSSVYPPGRHVAFVNGRDIHYHGSLYVHGSGSDPQGSWSDGRWRGLKLECKYIGGTSVNLKYTITDDQGNLIVSKARDIDYQIELGTSTPYWGFTASTGAQWEVNALTFGKLPQNVQLETHDLKYYVGQSWKPGEGVDKVIDEEGKEVKWGDPRLSVDSSQIDFSSPGTKIVNYTYKHQYGSVLIQKIVPVTITILEDQTNIKTKDSVLYVGQTWNKESNFVSATDEDGNAIPWSDSRISSNGASVDTSKPGTYNLTYTVKGKLKNVDSKFTVTVKEDKSSIQTKNTTLQVGQIWNKESNFVGATDEDGNAIPWSDSRISSNGASVDTSKPGVTKLRYTYKGKVKNTDSDFTVTVEDPLKLIVPSSSDFGTYKLGSSNTVLSWNKASKVEVEGADNSQWDLSVALNSKSSLKDYIKIGEIPITEASQKVLSGTGPMSVTDEVSPDKFIKVDYTGVKQLRKDTGTLQWALTPSTKGVSE